MNLKAQLDLCRQYMLDFHAHDYSGHDIAHVERVTSLALKIAKAEQCQRIDIVEIASLLHDTVDSKLTTSDAATIKLEKFLYSINLDTLTINEIIFIIKHLSYRNGENNQIPLSLEGQIVRDADRLDAIGAIGIARAFQFAGHFNEPMWTELPTSSIPSADEITTFEPSAIRHFYDKLLKLKDLMHTETARNIAIQRHDFMKQFINQFFDDWYQ